MSERSQPDAAARPPASHAPSSHDVVRVVLFSGGRGSGALTSALVQTNGIELTIAINGYDDGASTGEVRRFLGDALGPSDFRKNASRVAAALGSCPPALVTLLDRRLPDSASADTVRGVIASLRGGAGAAESEAASIPGSTRDAVAQRLERFLGELAATPFPFQFDDCSVGNLVFAGGYLLAGRRFNDAVDDYAALVGLRSGVIENVTDGTNAFLVAIDAEGRVLGSEAEIVDANRRNAIADIFLIAGPLSADDRTRLAGGSPDAAARELSARSVRPALNPRLAARLQAADLIIYAPGTQHSSLFPSYLTSGLSGAIARNLRAIKLLITNIQTDAEIAGSSAVDIVSRAVHYLKQGSGEETPTPALITHYLLNDPGSAAGSTPYVPLGRLDTLQDPRLVRVGQWEEEGLTGRHDALKVLSPFLDTLLRRHAARPRVAVLLYDAGRPDKLAVTLTEMVRGRIGELPVELTALCESTEPLADGFVGSLPFPMKTIPPIETGGDAALRAALRNGGYEYVVLFESSGMYNGEDIPWLVSHLTGRLDAVWGSRRLSVRDIQESYRLKYQHRAVLGTASYIGSHLLSLLYLLLYGRYVSDTLSGARAVRTEDVCGIGLPITHKRANQQLLSRLLRRKAEMFEVPVHFYSVSPEHVKRTTVLDGLRSIGTILWGRLRPAQALSSATPVESASPNTAAARQ